MKTIKQILMLLAFITLSSCVQESHQKEITVKLNMSNQDNPAKVGIRGAFPLSWDETTYLEDPDGDDIYEGQFKIYTASNDIAFKFVNQDNQFELKDKGNRILTFEYKPETIVYEAIFNDSEKIKITRK